MINGVTGVSYRIDLSTEVHSRDTSSISSIQKLG